MTSVRLRGLRPRVRKQTLRKHYCHYHCDYVLSLLLSDPGYERIIGYEKQTLRKTDPPKANIMIMAIIEMLTVTVTQQILLQLLLLLLLLPILIAQSKQYRVMLLCKLSFDKTVKFRV